MYAEIEVMSATQGKIDVLLPRHRIHCSGSEGTLLGKKASENCK